MYMFMSTYYFKDWIKEAVSRAKTEESWLELHTGGSHGVVIVHDKLVGQLSGKLMRSCKWTSNRTGVMRVETGFDLEILAFQVI